MVNINIKETYRLPEANYDNRSTGDNTRTTGGEDSTIDMDIPIGYEFIVEESKTTQTPALEEEKMLILKVV